jgi:hypothetical protein
MKNFLKGYFKDEAFDVYKLVRVKRTQLQAEEDAVACLVQHEEKWPGSDNLNLITKRITLRESVIKWVYRETMCEAVYIAIPLRQGMHIILGPPIKIDNIFAELGFTDINTF